MIFIYIVTAYLPSLISFHVVGFEDTLDTCETINSSATASKNVSLSFISE